MAIITTKMKQQTVNGFDDASPVYFGVANTDYIYKAEDEPKTLTAILAEMETRLANIEACLKEVAQEDGLIFNDKDKNPVG